MTEVFNHINYTDIDKLPPDAAPISENGLAQRAIFYAKTLNVKEVVLSSYTMSGGGTHNDKPTPIAHFFWKRRFGKIEYNNQHIAIGLDTYSGEIIRFSAVCLCPPPLPRQETISSMQAIKISTDFLHSKSVEIEPNPRMSKKVVNDGSWEDRSKYKISLKPGVVAWVMVFKSPESAVTEIYVDACDGRIVGGLVDHIRGIPSKISKDKSSAKEK